MVDLALRLRGFGVAFGTQPVLADVDLEVPARTILVLVGPSASGKSTLLRTLAGLNDAHPELATWGTALLDGEPLPEPREGIRPRVGLATQHSRFFLSTVRENLVSALPDRSRLGRLDQTRAAERLLARCGLGQLTAHLDADVLSLPASMQRMLAIVRATAGEPAVIMADEPTSGLDDAGARDVIALLRRLATTTAVVFVTHHQGHALAAGGTTALLAGGRVLAVQPTIEFFSRPSCAAAQSFVETGGCVVPRPGAPEESLDDALPPPPPLSLAARAATARTRSLGPRGFFWILPGRLAGVPRPGIIAELEDDLDGLSRVGVTLLVTLEETRTIDAAALAAVGVDAVHFPVPDMGAPALGPTVELCGHIAGRMAAGDVVSFHCRAGLGRTGTLLACQLVWAGDTALDAIDRVRRVNPRCIQSDEQAAFIQAFEVALRTDAPRTRCSTDSAVPSTERTKNVT